MPSFVCTPTILQVRTMPSGPDRRRHRRIPDQEILRISILVLWEILAVACFIECTWLGFIYLSGLLMRGMPVLLAQDQTRAALISSLKTVQRQKIGIVPVILNPI